MPAIDPGVGSGAGCADVVGEFRVRFPSIVCEEITGDTTMFTYSVNPMTAASATPTQLNQAGGPFGSPITDPPATITVTGTNFVDPMTVEIFGGNGAGIPVNNAIVANATQLSFIAPAVPDSALNSQPCVIAGGTSVTGTKLVPTSFGIRLTNARTGCAVELPNVLIYNPAEPACLSAITITGSATATATLCGAYGGGAFTVTGGVPPYTFVVGNLPPGITGTTAPTSVTINGVPEMPANGPGVASTPYAGLLTVSDSSPATPNATASIPITVTDPFAPFTVSASKTTLAATVSPSSDTATITNSTGSGPVTLTAGTVTPALPAGVTFTFAAGTATLARAAPGATGSSTVSITAADTACGATHHEAAVTLTLDY
jgi:hypothetical protein